ncbi:MAG: right-handed parallel beta-helix repeat-containing protein [Phycisphaerales bacterium]|nr:right-handed parallel beta-helix repeat-containing protein [Phycisphaerales bacterium]
MPSRTRRFITILPLLTLLPAAAAHADIINVPADHALIQNAINAANPGDEVVLAPGTYNETINMMGKPITLRSTDPLDPAVVAATIIDAQQTGTVITCNSGEGLDTVISGLTVTGGGIGLRCFKSGVTVSHCRVRDNDSRGVYTLLATAINVEDCVFEGNLATGFRSEQGSSITILRSIFRNNTASYDGGALHVYQGSLVIEDCAFEDNKTPITGSRPPVDTRGGAIYCWADSLLLSRCTFSGNLANFGGALRTYQCSAIITDCLFEENTATREGGALFNSDASPAISNCRFLANTASSGSGIWDSAGGGSIVNNSLFLHNTGIALRYDSASPLVTNSTLAANVGGAILAVYTTGDFHNCIFATHAVDPVFFANGGTTTITHSLIEGGYPGAGNIDADPLFVDADGPDNIPGTLDDDLRLRPGSPCIDAGDNTAVPLGVLIDLAGNPRFVDDSATADTGLGTPPIVDMGAFEFRGPCICDFDHNNTINLDDLQTLLFTFGTTVAPYTAGDATADSLVDLDDLQLLLFYFGSNC